MIAMRSMNDYPLALVLNLNGEIDIAYLYDDGECFLLEDNGYLHTYWIFGLDIIEVPSPRIQNGESPFKE